jgi:hypothetical protein
MSLDVYNFNATPQTVAITARARGGWAVTPAQRTVSIPANGRVSLPFTLQAGAAVRRGVDAPLAFAASVGGRPASPSASRILLSPCCGSSPR